MPPEDRHTGHGEGDQEEVRLEASIRDLASPEEVYRRLKEGVKYSWDEYVALVALKEDGSPFAVLAAVVLSQNTSDKNSIRAYRRLREKIGVSPESILEAPEEALAEAIRPAGLVQQKVRALKALAEYVISKGGEDALLREDPLRLREELLKLPGVGPKTVDVFLSVFGLAPVFAVDTHARRVAVRWGLVGPKASYEEVSKALLDFFGPEKAEEAHRLLIALGRRYCKARSPRCEECPLRGVCPWPRLSSRRGPGGRAGRLRRR